MKCNCPMCKYTRSTLLANGIILTVASLAGMVVLALIYLGVIK